MHPQPSYRDGSPCLRQLRVLVRFRLWRCSPWLACAFFPRSTGCCHTPTVNTNVTADGHMLTETPTPGNSGPVWGFTVPRHDAPCGPAVAVIDVDGILLNQDMSGPASAGENPVSLFRERLDAAAADPCTRAVVVRINSPGGGVTASDIMRHDLERFKENTRMPVIACLMDIGTSGGYYLATAADQIVAHPTTVTGGIGVILNLYNLAGVEEKYDIGYIPIKSPLGGNIDSGTIMTRPGMMDTRMASSGKSISATFCRASPINIRTASRKL